MQSCFSAPDVSSVAEERDSPTLSGGKGVDGGDSLALEDEEGVSTMMSGEEGEARGKDLEKDTGKKSSFLWGNISIIFFTFEFVRGKPCQRTRVASFLFVSRQFRLGLNCLPFAVTRDSYVYVSYLSICSPPLPNPPFITVEAEEVEEERKER